VTLKTIAEEALLDKLTESPNHVNLGKLTLKIKARKYRCLYS
jgi:hypothetical protein